MDSMKSWADTEEGKAGRSVCCVVQSVRVLVRIASIRKWYVKNALKLNT